MRDDGDVSSRWHSARIHYSSSLPKKLQLYIDIGNITRDMRLALATRDWDQVRSYCLQYETLTLKELSDRTNHDANGINVCEEVLRSLQPMVSISKRRERASRNGSTVD